MLIRTKEPRGGIERRILTSILWVGILPMAIALGVGIFTALDWQSKVVQKTLNSSAEQTAKVFRLVLDTHVQNLRALATSDDVFSSLDEDPSTGVEDTFDYLTDNVKVGDEEDSQMALSLYDSTGHLIVCTDSNYERDLQERELIRENKGFGHFLIPYPNEADSQILTITPVYTFTTNVHVGFLGKTVSLAKHLELVFGNSAVSNEGRYVSDIFQILYKNEQGKIMSAGLAKDMETGRSILTIRNAEPELINSILSNADRQLGIPPVIDYNIDDASTKVIYSYHPLPIWEDSYVVVFRPALSIFTSINIWALKATVAGFLFIAMLCLLAYRNVHNNITRNLSLLNEGAQIIRRGDFDLKLKINTGDEIEEVATSFNKMALALSRNIKQLEESEENYRSLVTSMRDGIYQTDLNGVITFLNPAGCEIFGYHRIGDALGQNLHELFLEEIDMAQMMSELENKGFVERTRVWMKCADGRTICVELSGNRLFDDEAVAVGIEGIFRDVTISVRLEQAARERSERIASINQIANVINSSLEAGRLYENLVAELKKLVSFDYAAVALLNNNKKVFDAWQLWPEHAAGPGHTYELDAKNSYSAWVAQNKKSVIIENRVDSEMPLDEHFSESVISCLSVPLYATGHVIGTLDFGSNRASAFSKHDIEVLEQVAPHIAVAIGNAQLLANLHASLEEVTHAREKLYEANEELKSLDEMKTNLLSNVSHELRTPLVSVMGYTDMILNCKAGPITETQKNYLGISLRNIEKLVTLIENLLDFSRLYRGTERLIFDTFDIVDCARTSIQIVQPVADGRIISLIINAPKDPVLVEGDKGKLGQVFNNLLSNAVKFNKSRGHVTVDIIPADDTVKIIVSDDGIGIPEEALDKVFTRFYQYDSSSTRKYGGTGIGLAISQDIARLHGSTIKVTSEMGKGSSFQFTLSRAETRSEGVQALAPTEKLIMAAQTHILIELVSQDRALSIQIRELLASEGIDMIHASMSSAAISLAQRHTPDIMLIDLGSTEKSEQVLDELLNNPTVSTLPIVILTNDDKLYDQYRSVVAARVRRNFRKSTLLSGISYALRRDLSDIEPLGEKILCVDDDQEILTFMRNCLEQEGYSVVECNTGEKAMELVESRDYGLVLLDIAMPGIDGWETCKFIKAMPSLSNINVYLVTAKPMGSNAARLQQCGADGYLLKPFRPDELIELVQGLNITRNNRTPEESQ